MDEDLTTRQGVMMQIRTGNQAQLVEYMRLCFETNTYADMYFMSSDGDTIPAHRIVVSSVSRKLKSLLSAQSEDLPFIVLPDFDSETIESLVSIMSYGEVKVNDASCPEKIKQLAEMLDIKALLDLEIYAEEDSSHVKTMDELSQASTILPMKKIPEKKADQRKSPTSPQRLHKTSKALEISKKSLLPPLNEFLAKNESPLKNESPNATVKRELNDSSYFQNKEYSSSEVLSPNSQNYMNGDFDYDVNEEHPTKKKKMMSTAQKDNKGTKPPTSSSANDPETKIRKPRGRPKSSPPVRNCPKCGKTFYQERYTNKASFIACLSRHSRSCKGPKSNFFCGYCGKSFGQKKFRFQMHMASCSQPRTCFTCGKEFRSTHMLRIHICKGGRTPKPSGSMSNKNEAELPEDDFPPEEDFPPDEDFPPYAEDDFPPEEDISLEEDATPSVSFIDYDANDQ